MPPLQIPIDGLLRCLCPSIDAILLSRSSRCLPSIPRKARPRIRQIHSSSRVRDTSTPNFLNSTSEHLGSFHAFNPSSKSPFSNEQSTFTRNQTDTSRPISAAYGHAFKEFDKHETPELHDMLRELPLKAGTYHQIAELVQYLILVRKERPALLHYDALVRANADAEHGNVEIVKGLLQEMAELEIRGDAEFYQNILLVLAIHPDYVLRGEIIQTMKERWFGLSPEGSHWLVVGLIRDRQFEVAMDKLEQMQADQVTIQAWLYDIFMFQLCEFGELDEAWKLLKYRWEHDRSQIWSSVYYYLLDKFSRGFHYDGVKFIWKMRVQSDIIVPSDGMCMSVLNIAARYADPGLATSVMRVLSARRATLAPYHYEALIAAYTGFGDLTTAFRLLAIMTKAGVEPGPSTTRDLYVYLSKDPSLPCRAWETLEQLFEDGHKVPIAAVNVVIESYIAIHQFDAAMDAYKDLHTICEAGPDTETFNVLFQGSTRSKRKDTSMFLAAEMHALGIPADNLTYDRLILVCLQSPDYEDAFRYLEEMVLIGADRIEEGTGKFGWWMRKGTATQMVKNCTVDGDERVWGILVGMRERGMKTERLEAWVRDNWRGRPVGEEVAGEVSAGEGGNGAGEVFGDEVRRRQEERLKAWNAAN